RKGTTLLGHQTPLYGEHSRPKWVSGISRPLQDALPRFLDLLNRGIRVVTLSDGKVYDDQYNELDLIISIVHMSRAHNESEIKGQRVSRAWTAKQERARTDRTPLGKACPQWLTLEDGAYQPISERVEVIREIFQLTQDGHGQRAIAKLLNERGLPPFGSVARNVSQAWGASSVKKLLTNRALLGEYQPTNLVDGVRQAVGEPVQGFFPSIISEEVFYSAQAASTQRKVSGASKQSQSFNLWQGIAKCGLCGNAMHLVNKGLPPKGGRYLRCFGAAKGICKAKLIPLARSENVFRELLTKVDSLSLVQDSSASMRKALSVLQGRESEVKQRLQDLEVQVMAFGSKLPATIIQIMSTLESELSDNQQQQETVKADLQREQIINKTDFLSRVDLVSYEGRARANSLLKSLGITISIKDPHPLRTNKTIVYWLHRNGEKVVMYSDGENGGYWVPLDADVEALANAQGDGFAESLISVLETRMGDTPGRRVRKEDLEKAWEVLKGN
ncbi:recombinase family protein, partial [Nocardiopsis alba]|uniref:recombinase family protein n=1 Tax=Nocardiopsis alba TaxID=53437 RepID=UPI00343B24FC